MMHRPPRLRRDLTLRALTTASETCLIVKDPVTERFYRFGEIEEFIARQLDGETPLDTIRQRAEEHFGGELPSEVLVAFVRNLEQAGLLHGSSRSNYRKKRISGNFLYLRFRLLDPTRVLDRLAPRVRYFFTPQFVVFSAVVIALAVGVAYSQWSAYTEQVTRLFRASIIPAFLILGFIVISLHEFAHGLTLRYFGGEVREMGFMLIYMQPAFYCNVSDAWLLPEKRKRLWVSFAGGYFELFLWALAVLIWRATEFGTTINELALVVMTTSGVKTLLNFNPLIKLDGYYLASDWLGIPNLRRRSFRIVGHGIERLLHLDPLPLPDYSPRDRRILWVYGLTAGLGSFLIAAYVLVTQGSWLIQIGQPIPFMMLSVLVGAKFRRRYKRAFRPGASDPDEDEDDDEPDIAPSPETEAPRKAKEKKISRRWRKRLLWLAVAAIAALAAFLGRLELRIAGPFSVLPEQNADVRAAVDGIIDQVLVNEGDHVQAGDVIARMAAGPLQNDLQKTNADLGENRATLQKLVAGPTAAEIDVAKAGVSKAKDQATFLRERLPRYQQLLDESLLSRMAFEEAQQEAVMAENDLLEAQRKLDLLVIGTRPEEVEATRAKLDGLGAQKRYLEQQLSMLDVTTPIAGVIATPALQLRQMSRQFVKQGDLIAQVYDVSTVSVDILVSEKDIADIRVGQPVVVRARAYPNVEFRGEVTFIATSAQGSSGLHTAATGTTNVPHVGSDESRAVLVSTRIANPDLLLKPEMTGQAKIYCGKRRISELFSRRATHTLKVDFWSWW